MFMFKTFAEKVHTVFFSRLWGLLLFDVSGLHLLACRFQLLLFLLRDGDNRGFSLCGIHFAPKLFAENDMDSSLEMGRRNREACRSVERWRQVLVALALEREGLFGCVRIRR